MNAGKRADHPLWKLLAAAIGVGVGVLGMEVVCSLFFPVPIGPVDFFDDFFVPDPELGYRMRPSFSGDYEQDYRDHFRTNAQGLRGDDYGPKAPGALRVLAVGDSFTFGAGVLEDEAWPKQLERALEDAGRAAEVINAGTSGYGTRQYAAVVRRLLPVYEPDLVAVMVTYNDPGNDVATEQGVYPPLKTGQHPAKRWLKRHSHLAKQLWRIYLEHTTPELSFADADTLYRDVDARGEEGERSRHGFALFDAAVLEMAALARASGADVVFAASSDLDHPVTRHLSELCAREGIPFTDVFRRVSSGDVAVSFRGRNSAGHWSPAGHREVAAALAEAVVSSNFALVP